MKTNVADILGRKFRAVSIQCEPSDNGEFLRCVGTNNADAEEGFHVDWSIQVDEITARDVTAMEYSQFIKMASIPPIGGVKICTPILGNARGQVNLICSQKEKEVNEWINIGSRRPEGFKEDLVMRNLMFDDYEKTILELEIGDKVKIKGTNGTGRITYIRTDTSDPSETRYKVRESDDIAKFWRKESLERIG